MYLAQQSEYSFLLVQSAFHPARNEAFTSAWVTLNLHRTDQVAVPQPIAWSMYPNSIYEETTRTTTIYLDSKVKLEGVAKVTGIPNQQFESRDKKVRRLLKAFGEQTSTPTWHFRVPPQQGLSGTYSLIVRIPPMCPHTGCHHLPCCNSSTPYVYRWM